MIFRETGGLNFVLKDLVFSIYCSDNKINPSIRKKIKILTILEKNNIFLLNETSKSTKNEWLKQQNLKELNEIKGKIINESKQKTSK